MSQETYVTWYSLKTELQKKVGRSILTHEWLAIKPREPLPWHKSTLNSTLAGMRNIKYTKVNPAHRLYPAFRTAMANAQRG
jgi:hypothetical protein